MFKKINDYFSKQINLWGSSKSTFKEKISKKIKINNEVIDGKLKSTINVVDRELYWKNAKFRLVSEVKVIDNRPVDVCFYGEFNLMQLLYFREELIEGLASIEEEIKKRQDIASN